MCMDYYCSSNHGSNVAANAMTFKLALHIYFLLAAFFVHSGFYKVNDMYIFSIFLVLKKLPYSSITFAVMQ